MYLKDLMDEKQNQISFHMPGHKENYTFFEKDVLNYDLTEYADFDNLANPTTVIKNSIERIQRVFKSTKSYILVNGSTGGILATLFYLNSLGGTILAYRHSHKSFFNGVTLTGQTVEYITPIIDENGFIYKLNYEEIEKKFDNNKDIKYFFITSPTYEGVSFDLKKLSEITKKRSILLVVDSAHGAHFSLSNNLPDSSTSYADISIMSLHKTLPALTQTSLLHTTTEHMAIEKYINMLQTSSPSYLFMYTIDKLMEDIESKKLDFENYINHIKAFRQKLSSLKNIHLFDTDNIDITRVTLYSNKISGEKINDYLKSKNIYCEMYMSNYIVLITSICDKPEYYDSFINAITILDNQLDKNDIIVDNQTNLIYNNIETVYKKTIYSLKEASLMNYEAVNINDSLDRVSKDFVVPYPPGIPILLPGECITKEFINIVNDLISENIEILGLSDKEVNVIIKE